MLTRTGAVRPAGIVGVIMTLALIVVQSAPAAMPQSSPSPAGTLQERQSELRRLLNRLTQSRSQLREVRTRERRVLGELEDIDRTKDSAERRLSALSTELSQTRGNAQATATQLALAERRLRDHRTLLRGRLRDVYKYGRTGYADVLFGASDFGEFVTRWHFVSAIVHADGRLISDYESDVAEYQKLQTTLRREQAQLETITVQTQVRRREIVQQEQAKRAVLTRLQRERAAYEQMVRELEEDSKELEVLILRTQTRSGLQPAVALRLRTFVWPARGGITSGFGFRRHPIFGIRRMHTGVDIGAPRGAPVEAAAAGRVIYTGWFGGYGKIVIIDHGGGVSTLYAHLSQILTEEGRNVEKGEVIARVGSTGYSTGPHLHFEVRLNGRPIDPTRR
ncbi:MAG TPA: peptidoglycan DD-metalloendopeptidase family protein [bacterium]